MSERTKESVTIHIKLSKKVYERLKEQLKIFRDHGISGLGDQTSVEELIAFFITQFTTGEEKMRRIEDRMQGVLNALKDKGVDVMDLFNSFSRKLQEEENENDSDIKKKDKEMNVEKKKS